MKLEKRLNDLEKRSSPERIRPIIELVGSRDQVHNRGMYDRVPHSSKGSIDIFRLSPKPGYTPPDDPMQVNE